MKGLTFTQPWASLVALGAKLIETRSWATSYRGPIAIHAGKGLKPAGGRSGLFDLCWSQPFLAALEPGMTEICYRDGEPYPNINPDALPLGAIIAVAELIDCVPTHNPAFATDPGQPWFTGARKGTAQHYYEVPPREPELSFGDYSPGRYAWLLADVRRLAEPVPCPGALSLWAVPDDAAALVRAQL